MTLVTGTSAAGQEVASSAAERFWRDAVQQRAQEGRSDGAGAAACAFDVVYATTTAEAAAVLARALRTFRHGPPAVSSGCSVSSARRGHLPRLQRCQQAVCV